MPPQPTRQANIEQLHELAEEMDRPAPSMARAFLLPFCIGAAFALTVFIVVVLEARL
ncbi:hypothetical protein [Pseudomonas sp. NPDC087336]|jgi:hypothetical protein|uniref:hypothetical protein n=1 Tax=Pseudomonas sp. NPDC087336 TaxID=3364436 RepID=UPI00380DB68D